VTRTLIGGIALASIVVALTAVTAGCGGTSTASAADARLQREADLYQLDQIEVKFHRATSTQNLKLMMSLFAPGAVFNVDQKTLTGKAQIRHWFATENKAFLPGNHWESDTPSYKLRATVNGDKGTLYFECHYIDPKTQKVVAYVGVQHEVQKIDGTWLITNSAASPAVLSP
jgi:ABC-type glycerol-3-phosphate transport system substrate-binding protein